MEAECANHLATKAQEYQEMYKLSIKFVITKKKIINEGQKLEHR